MAFCNLYTAAAKKPANALAHAHTSAHVNIMAHYGKKRNGKCGNEEFGNGTKTNSYRLNTSFLITFFGIHFCSIDMIHLRGCFNCNTWCVEAWLNTRTLLEYYDFLNSAWATNGRAYSWHKVPTFANLLRGSS